MSATYKLIGKRWLRKYTAASVTPVYAAESEVAKLANSLCNVAWQSVSPKDAQMSYHTDNVVAYSDPSDDTTGIKGLDYNVQIRDSFDAALFCGYHVNETHRVYGNAACYKYILPDMATYPTLESLKVNVTSDPYNSTGARIAIFTNSTGVIPTACSDCRQGSAPLSTDHSCTQAEDTNDWTTNDTYAEAVCPREARTTTTGTGSKATTSTSWYPVRGTCTFDLTTPLQLCKYVYVFVLLENYNACRGNWIEGCSFIDNLVEMTTSSAVSAWDARVSGGETVIDASADGGTASTAASGYIVANGGFQDVAGSGRKYVVVEAPRCGVKSPDRVAYTHIQETAANAIAWMASDPDGIKYTFSGRIVGCTPLDIVYIDRCSDSYTLPQSQSVAQYSLAGGIVATYDPYNDGSGTLPGISFYVAAYPSYSSSTPTRHDFIPFSPNPTGISAAAKEMLVSGTVKRIFLVPLFVWFNQSAIPSVQSQLWSYDRTGILVVVSSDSQTEVVGVLVNTTYKTKTDPTTGWAMYKISNSDSFGQYGLISCAFPYSRIRSFVDLASAGSAFHTGTMTFDDSARTITYANEQSLPSKVLVYSWVQARTEGSILLKSNKAGVVACYGEHLSAEQAGNFGSVETQTAYSTIVVCGNLTRVGSTECKNVAYVDMYPSDDGSVTDATVVVPAYDAALTPIMYDDSFRVLPATPALDAETVDTYKAFVSSKAGFLVNGSVMFTAKVDSSNVLSAVGTAVNYGLGSVARAESFGTVVFGFSDYTAVYYGATGIDSLLQQSDNSVAYYGLRNCIAAWVDGRTSLVSAADTGGGKVGFTISPVTRSLPITTNGGLTATTVSFPLWRITASCVLVPFVMPSESSMSGRVLRLAWSALSNCTAGTVFNVWAKSSEVVTDYDDSMADIKLYSAEDTSVNGWTLLGSVPASNLSCEFDVSGVLKSGKSCTLLLTAWYPHELMDLSGTVPSVSGVGTFVVDPMTGTSGSTEANGWMPQISIHE